MKQYRVLLVDDEKLQLETLRDYIDWQEMNLCVIGTCKNGREALQKTLELKPDIVLTDVKMPIMDGLEFARQLRGYNTRTKVVFLSGYDEFQFIKAAMNTDASGYLLKPIDVDELKEIVNRIIIKIEEEKLAFNSISAFEEQYLKNLIIEENTQSIKELYEPISKMTTFNNDINKPFLKLILVSIDNIFNIKMQSTEEVLLKQLNNIVHKVLTASITTLIPDARIIKIEDYSFAILLDAASIEYLHLDELCNAINLEILQLFNTTLTFGTCDTLRLLTEIHVSYKEAKKAVAMRFYLGLGKLIIFDPSYTALNIFTVSKTSTEKDLLSSLLSGDETKFSSIISDYFNSTRHRNVCKQTLCSNVFSLITSVCNELFKHNDKLTALFDDRNIIWDNVFHAETIDQLSQYVLQTFYSLINYITDNSLDKHQQIVVQVKEIVEQSYGTMLTVEDISKKIYLSPNYIRAIFKEKTGDTILEYITKVRIEKALELLKDKSLKIHEVSNAVGYENVSYFCSIFQKYKGMTPNEFRKKLL